MIGERSLCGFKDCKAPAEYKLYGHQKNDKDAFMCPPHAIRAQVKYVTMIRIERNGGRIDGDLFLFISRTLEHMVMQDTQRGRQAFKRALMDWLENHKEVGT